jgi:anti-sigma regulatory factor (Ser/Thr protein kinase)
VLRETLTTYLTANGIDDAASRMIVLCADEALINAVAHAADSPVGVFADLRDDHLTIDVSDGGRGFDPSQIDTGAEPDLMGEHGRGLFLIHNLMDDFEILSDERGTTLHMERDLPGVRLSSRRRRGDLGAADVAAPGRGGGGLAGAHAASTPTPRPATSPEVAGGPHKSFAASPR